MPAEDPRTSRGNRTADIDLDASSAAVVARPADPVSSVENVLQLLILLRDRKSIRGSEAAVELGVSRSTAHRLLAMLRSYQFVEQDPRAKTYHPGPVLAELGLASLRQDDVLTALHPFLRELSETVNETVHIIVLEGRNCRFVDSVECRQALRTTSRIGLVYPAHATSGGKALLAELDDAQLLSLYPQEELAPLNEHSLVRRDQLFDEIRAVRENGYALNLGESEMGISAVAMSQRTSRGVVPAAVAISAPEQRLTEKRLPELVAALRAVTARASARLP